MLWIINYDFLRKKCIIHGYPQCISNKINKRLTIYYWFSWKRSYPLSYLLRKSWWIFSWGRYLAAKKFKFPQLNCIIHYDLHENIVIRSYLFKNHYPPKFYNSKIWLSNMNFMDTLGSAILYPKKTYYPSEFSCEKYFSAILFSKKYYPLRFPSVT